MRSPIFQSINTAVSKSTLAGLEDTLIRGLAPAWNGQRAAQQAGSQQLAKRRPAVSEEGRWTCVLMCQLSTSNLRFALAPGTVLGPA